MLSLKKHMLTSSNDIRIWFKEGLYEKNKLVLKYSKWAPDIHTVFIFLFSTLSSGPGLKAWSTTAMSRALL